MPRQARAAEEHSPRTKLVLAFLVSRAVGACPTGVDASAAPKGSAYHHVPGGKRRLVIEALFAVGALA